MRLAVKIQGEQVRLVPYLARHVDKYHSWMQDPWLLEKTASESLSLEEERKMQVSWRDDPNKATFIIFAHSFSSRNEDETESGMVGDVNLFFNDDEDKHNCEIDVMIAEPSWRGKGLGKEGVLLMMAYAVHTMRVTRFYSKINESNAASLGLFCK
jgi:RimJ/RimL family protein N-acetyltransferase